MKSKYVQDSLDLRHEFKSELTALLNKLPQIESYANQCKLIAEPHTYPKGLFLTVDSSNRFNIASYLDEIHNDINRLMGHSGVSRSSLEIWVKRIQNKVEVLVNSLHSQALRKDEVAMTKRAILRQRELSALKQKL